MLIISLTDLRSGFEDIPTYQYSLRSCVRRPGRLGEAVKRRSSPRHAVHQLTLVRDGSATRAKTKDPGKERTSGTQDTSGGETNDIAAA